MPEHRHRRREPLARLWLLSFGAAALLVVGTAWLASRDPVLAGEARAIADARVLVPLLEDRGASFARAMALGTTGAALALEFRCDPAGTLLDPAPLPAGAAVHDRTEDLPPGAPSPAMAWLADARAQLLRGDPRQALELLDQAQGALTPDELAMPLRLRLARAEALMAAGRAPDAVSQLRELLSATRPDHVLDGASLFLVASHRLAAASQAAGDADQARQVRQDLLAALLAGRLPLEPGRWRYEALALLADLPADPEQDAAQEQAVRARIEHAAARFRAAAALQQALAAHPGAEILLLENERVAFLAPATGAGLCYDQSEALAALHAAWNELLPSSGAFALARAADAAPGAVLGVPAAPAPLPSDLRLILARPELYSGPAARRQLWLWTATGVLVVALAAVGILGARALARRSELERLRGDFVAAVSHELRTPAASIALLADNLAEGRVPGGARQHEYFTALRRDAARLQRLVADVLDWSRLERGAFRVETCPTRPDALLQRVAEEQRARLADAGLRLELDIEPGLPETALDADAVERALYNLLENARRYAAAGGLVRLCARRDSGCLLLAVEDAGPGIPHGWRERVFQPFQRGPAGSGSASAGAGLGLALVRQTARAHGGDVSLDAGRDGRGARFTLHFPLTPP